MQKILLQYDHQQINPLVHFIFIYYMAVTPYYISLRLPLGDIERFNFVEGSGLIAGICEKIAIFAYL